MATDNPRPKSQPPVVAVIPAESGTTAADPGSVEYGLGRSLANHLEYLATLCDRGVVVHRWNRPAAISHHLDSLYAEGVNEVLIVRYAGDTAARPAQAQDAHRRRYMTLVPGCLQVTVGFERWRKSSTGWEVIAVGSIDAVGTPDEAVVTRDGSRPKAQPYDLVVQRVVTELGEHLPSGERPSRALRAVLPVKIYLGAALADDPEFTEGSARQLVDMASDQFVAQFDVALRLVGVEALPPEFAEGGSLQDGYPGFHRAMRQGGDTLIVALNRRLSREEYFGNEWREEIGMARVGQRRVYMDLLPPPFPGDTIWQTVANGLTLLHEIGHALGGIHVSDINSVMAHRANWVNAATFDRVNEEIISRALSRTTRFDDPAEYLAMVVQILDSAVYWLADYPEFFHQSLRATDNPVTRQRLREAIGRKSLLLATDAVGLLTRGRRALAARYLKTALQEDAEQAALWYYLSLAMDGPSADAARRKALQMGYMMAGEKNPARIIDEAAVDNARKRR